MLLYLLSKKEKESFLDLAAVMTSADGVVEETESTELKILTNELGDDCKGYTAQDAEKAIKYLENSSSSVRRIVLLNLIIISISDDFYHAEEHMLIERLLEQWSITLKKKAELFKLVYNYKDLREKAKFVVNS